MKKLGLRIKNLLNTPAFLTKAIKVVFMLLAFFIPFVAAILLFKVNGYYPFVKNGQTLMMIDMSGQYISFFRYYKDILDGKTSLLYTLSKATGGDFLSLFMYYLSSPFNLLLKFFSAAELPKGLMWIVILKISSAGLTAYLALNKVTKNKAVALILSIAYALNAYSFVYYSNIMWLDGVVLVPLIALGIINIVQNKSPLLYIIALGVAITANWYIGIMLCMFAVFFFLVQFLATFKKSKKMLKPLLVFTVGSLIAGAISFGIWGTALSTMLGTKGANNFTNLSQTLHQYYDLFKIQSGFVYESYNGMSDINGVAVNFYVGALPVVLVLLYFFNPRFSRKEKLGAVLILVLYLIAFLNKGIDHLFHGGPAPNWFPGRYAFIFSFLLVYYAAKSLQHIKSINILGFIVTPLTYIAFYYSLDHNNYKVPSGSVHYFVLVYFLLLILAYSDKLIALLKNNEHQKNTTTAVTSLTLLGLSVVALLNVYGNNNHILAAFNKTLAHPSLETYQQGEVISKAVKFVQTQDTSLYRMEKSFIRDGAYNNSDNDSLYYGYNGISHFSSTEKSEVNNYLKKLGFHYNGYHLNYVPGSTLSASSFLGVKYLLDRPDSSSNSLNKGFVFPRALTKLDDGLDDGIDTYLNNYALPLLMATTPQQVDFVNEGRRQPDGTMRWFNRFEYQNEVFKNLSRDVVDEDGKPKDIFRKATYDINLIKATKTAEENTYNGQTGGQINYRVVTNEPGNYYYYITASNMTNLELFEANSFVRYFTYFSHQINGLGKSPNPTTTLRVSFKSAATHKVTEEIYYEDLAVLQEYIDAIKNKAVVTSFTTKNKETYTGKVTTKSADQPMLLTIPNDKNFKVKVDGKTVESEKRFNIYTGFIIKNPGEHKITVTYQELIFQIGVPLGIFIMGATIFAHFKLNKILFKREEDEITS